MNNDFAFLFKPGDYLRDTQCLSEKTQVAYDRIMCEHMRSICISKQQLKFFTKRLNEEELEELNLVLTKVGDGFQIFWVAESIKKRIAYIESRSRNSSKSHGDHMKSYAKHSEDENENEDRKEDEISKERGVGGDGKTANDLWVAYASNNAKLPNAMRLTKTRARKCLARLTDPDFYDKFIMAVRLAQDIPFLYGNSDRGWKADFDWFIANDTNVFKVLEGKYSGSGGKNMFDRHKEFVKSLGEENEANNPH